jgi:hypothetical protein
MFKFPVGLSVYELFLALLSLITGGIVIYKKCRAVLAMLVLPILFTLIASGFHVYPFEGRLLLFMTPLLILLIAEGIVYIGAVASRQSRILGFAMILLLLVYPTSHAVYRLMKPRAPEELRPVLEHVVNNYRDGEALYVYYASYNAFNFYQRSIKYQGDVYIGAESRDNWAGYYYDLHQFKGRERVWFIFSHIATAFDVDEKRLFLSYLNILGKQLDEYQAPGAAAYLYSFK